jgi:hypothetical protein
VRIATMPYHISIESPCAITVGSFAIICTDLSSQ